MTDEKKTHWKRLINPEYIGAYALPPGQDMTVEITSVAREKIVVTGGKKEEHTVARLRGQKPLILNSTNSKSIARMHGPYIEDWAGKRVTLYASTTKLKGEEVECIRIRPERTDVGKPDIAHDRLLNAIASIKAGTFTVEKLIEKFALTQEQEDFLNDQLAAPEGQDNA